MTHIHCFFIVFHSLSIVCHGFFIVFHGLFMLIFQRTGFQRTGNPSVFIDGHPSMISLMDIHQWIHWWTPSMNSLMVHQWIWSPSFGPLSSGPFLWALSFGLFFWPFLWAPLGPGPFPFPEIPSHGRYIRTWRVHPVMWPFYGTSHGFSLFLHGFS